MADWFWTFGRGICVGYRRDDHLFRHDGVEIGRFHGDEVYGTDGRHLGEIRNERRLITILSKRGQTRSAFTPTRTSGFARYSDYNGYAIYAGYEDFPDPTDFGP